MEPIRFITLNPGHFHAALVQRAMYPGVSPLVHVYGPMGPDLVAHLQRIAGFNTRPRGATQWDLEVHASADFVARFQKEKPGNVVVLAGQNANKIDAILAALEADMHVLADKPWILVPGDLPKLERALTLAKQKGKIAYDIMTERYEITSILQRELVQDSAVFGEPVAGSPSEPGVYMESVHYLKKNVAGAPLRRPAWFFDVHQQGEGLSDVGTHLVDLVTWILFADQPISKDSDVFVNSARRTATVLTKADFQAITGEADFPSFLHDQLAGHELPYYCNTYVDYTVRGIHVKLDFLWDLEAPGGGGDTHLAVFRGSNARVEVRQGKEEHFVPQLYVFPQSALGFMKLSLALKQSLARLQARFPGLDLVDHGTHFQIAIPTELRVGHEPHFAQVTEQFLRYIRQENTMPTWEDSCMLAKYFVTTKGVELARKNTLAPRKERP